MAEKSGVQTTREIDIYLIVKAIEDAVNLENEFLVKSGKSLFDMNHDVLVNSFLKKLNELAPQANYEWRRKLMPNEKKELPPVVVDLAIKTANGTIAINFGNKFNYHDIMLEVAKLKRVDEPVSTFYVSVMDRPQDDIAYENYKTLLAGQIGLNPDKLIYESSSINTAEPDNNDNRDYKAAIHVWQVR